MSTCTINLSATNRVTDATFSGVGASTFGRLVTDATQAQAERSLDARYFRVPIRWDGSKIVSSAAYNNNREIEAALQVYWSWPGVRLLLVVAGRTGDWTGYQAGDASAIVGRLKTLGMSDWSRIDFSGPNEPDLNGASGMDEVADRCIQIAGELASAGTPGKVWGPVWSNPGGDFARFADRVGAARLGGIDWHSYPGGAGTQERSTAQVMADVADHYRVVAAVRSMLDGKGMTAAGINIDELNWSWQHDHAPPLFTTANTVMLALGYCAILSAGGRAMTYATQNGDLSVLADTSGNPDGWPLSSPMPAYWGIGALTGAGMPGQSPLFPHHAGAFLTVTGQDDAAVITHAMTNEAGGHNVVVVNTSETTKTHTLRGLSGRTAKVFQTRASNPYDAPQTLSTARSLTGTDDVALPGMSVTVLSLLAPATDRVEWAIRATETGPDLLTGTATPTAGTGTRSASAAPAVSTVVAAGAGYGVRWRGVRDSGAAEAWKWRALVRRAATTAVSFTDLWRSPQQVDSRLAANPEMQPLADTPTAKWVVDSTSRATVEGWARDAGGKTMPICLYAIPGRDAGSSSPYSGGGFTSRQAYLDFVAEVIAGIGAAPAVLLLEPDALGLSRSLGADAKTERIETLRLMVNAVAKAPNARVYIDASKWVPPVEQATLLRSVDAAKITGFVINVSGYDDQATCEKYGSDVIRELDAIGITGKRFVVDTSRNGAGALTRDFPGSASWLDSGEAWCNPPGRRVGVKPGPSTAPGCDANLWVKAPGESDGTRPTLAQSSYYGESAPAAGTFWVAAARDLLGLSPQPADTGTTPAGGLVSDVVADFESAWGPFTNRSAGTSLVAGRARVAADSTYASISTPQAYTLRASSVRARLRPPAAPSGATAVDVSLVVQSPTEGTRLRVQVDVIAGQLRCQTETGYYDESAVSVGYDPVSMAWVRLREAGGTVVWETSPDGQSWTTRRSMPKPAWVRSTPDCSVNIGAYASTGASFAEVDGVNPPAAQPVTRQSMVFGTDKPTTDLAGVPAGMTLTTVTGNQFYDTAGAVVEGKRFTGRVTVRAADVTFLKCRFEGPLDPGTSDNAVINATNAAVARLLLEDCTISPQTPSIWQNGINGHDYTFRRCLVEKCVDGGGVYNTTVAKPYKSGVNVEGCIFQDPFFDAQSTQSDGWTHNDTGLQIHGGQDGRFVGNLVKGRRWTGGGNQSNQTDKYVNGAVLSCVLFNTNVGDCSGWTVDRNWFEGAYFGVEAAGVNPVNVGSISGNRFDGTAQSGRDINLGSGQSAVVTTDNVLYSGGPARVLRNG